MISGTGRRWWAILTALAVLTLAPLLAGPASPVHPRSDVAGLRAELSSAAFDRATLRSQGDVRGRSWTEDAPAEIPEGGDIAVTVAVAALTVIGWRRLAQVSAHQALLRHRRRSVAVRAPPLLLRA
ncbi:MAG: hypothetical protein ACR2K0_01545 [Acidimicrobiales bacterium]